MASGIYSIRNLLNNKMYIGSALNLSRRMVQHFNALRKNKHHNQHLQNAFNKYEEESFTWEVLEFVEDKTQLISVEEVYIKRFDIEDTLYNICKEVPSSQLGTKRTDETKRKIGEKSLGRRHTEETKEIIRRKNTAPSAEIIRKRVEKATGQKRSEETKEKLRVAGTKRTNSPETRAKISKSNSGRKASEESRKKMSESLKGNTNALGMKHTDEAKKKMSEASRKYWDSKKND